MRVLSCNKCGARKYETEFYDQRNTFRGKMLACKECVKARARQYREDNLEKVQEYDRQRGALPHRKAANRAREHRYTKRMASQKWRTKNPQKWAAHIALNNAVKRGEITKPTKCDECARDYRVHGHHDDYSKPLEVRWLCPVCHAAHHKKLREIERMKVAAE